MARAAVQGNHLNTFGRLFAVARAVGPAWTFINLEGFFSLEDVAPTLLEGLIWRLRLVLLLLPVSRPQYKRSREGLLGAQGSTLPKGRSNK